MTTIGIFKFVQDVLAFPAGTALMTEGEPGDYMYVIREGEVEVLLGGEVIEVISENGIVGEMALIDNGPRSATAVAKTDVKAVAVDTNTFLRYISHTPFFALQVMRIMNQRLRNIMELYGG